MPTRATGLHVFNNALYQLQYLHCRNSLMVFLLYVTHVMATFNNTVMCRLTKKNPNDTIGNRTRDHPTCSAVPQLRHRVPLDTKIIQSYSNPSFVFRCCCDHRHTKPKHWHKYSTTHTSCLSTVRKINYHYEEFTAIPYQTRVLRIQTRTESSSITQLTHGSVPLIFQNKYLNKIPNKLYRL